MLPRKGIIRPVGNLLLLFTLCVQPNNSFSRISLRTNEAARVKAQSSKSAHRHIPEDFENCEILGALLDKALAEQEKYQDSIIIVIARMGKDEIRRNLNGSRLEFVKKYLKVRGPNAKYVCAQGERTEAKGELDIYVNGKLIATGYIGKNAPRFCMGTIG